MKRKQRTVLLGLLFLLMGCLSGGFLAEATTTGAGGQTTVDGTITFTEASTEPTVSTTESTLPDTGGGKLPQTGETIRHYSAIGGGILLLLLLLIWYRKRNKKEGET